jgi:cysteine synthase B
MEIRTIPYIDIRTPPLSGLEFAVGETPLLPLNNITRGLSPRVRVYAKAEWFNPAGSVKDRPALNIIHTALADGSLVSGKRLLDSTSGNMGISYSTFCASLGIPVTLVMPANASLERVTIMRALGAELILSDPLEGSDGAIHAARKLYEENPDLYFYANQYDNPANWLAHYRTTGPEIYQATGGEITHFIAGMGTTGTITGVTRYLRQNKPDVRSIAIQPDDALHGLEGLKHLASTIKPEIYDPNLPDWVIKISTENAYKMVRRLAREEGLFVGVSSGAAAAAAIQIARELEEGFLVTVFPDAGYKYLSEENIWKER